MADFGYTMKIESAAVSLVGQQSRVEWQRTEERLRTWVGPQRPDFERLEAGASALLDLSAAARQMRAANPVGTAAATEVQTDPDALDSDPKLQLLSRMIELMTGRKPRLFNASVLREKADPASDNALRELRDPRSANGAGGAAQRVGWGLEYDRTELRYEAQSTRFAAQGVVRTADGQTIAFAVSLEMKREYYEASSVSIRAGDAVLKDPLVINFNGTAAQLSGMRFDFDLDADGQTENIAFVGAGSGLLALDRNGNGRIDDGRELFGALSGDGFADLAAYDDDGNGWIDENDAVFHQLLVWQKDLLGQDRLSTLAEAGVGALYLGRVDTPFSLRDGDNRALGEVRSTGLYLKEAGGAGTLQQIDIVV